MRKIMILLAAGLLLLGVAGAGSKAAKEKATEPAPTEPAKIAESDKAGEPSKAKDGEESGWQLQGNAASKYEEAVVPYIFRPWAKDLVIRAQLTAGQAVLDVGCGTGAVVREAAPLVGPTGKVIGLDINASMIEVARSLPLDSALKVEWQIGDAQKLPFPDKSFDRVLSQQVFQFVPDKLKAASEMHRTLKPGGTATVSVWTKIENAPYAQAIMNAATKNVSKAAGDKMNTPFTTDEKTLREAFTSAGFAKVEIEKVKLTIEIPDVKNFVAKQLRALPFAREIEAANAFDKMLEDIMRSIDGSVKDGAGSIVWETYVVSATR